MTKLFSRAGRLLCFLLPLLLGMAGLWALAGEPFLDALFCCVSMYVLNYGDTPPNLLVELARWLAEAGFGKLRQYGNLVLRAPRPGEGRIFFSARKPAP